MAGLVSGIYGSPGGHPYKCGRVNGTTVVVSLLLPLGWWCDVCGREVACVTSYNPGGGGRGLRSLEEIVVVEVRLAAVRRQSDVSIGGRVIVVYPPDVISAVT